MKFYLFAQWTYDGGDVYPFDTLAEAEAYVKKNQPDDWTIVYGTKIKEA